MKLPNTYIWALLKWKAKWFPCRVVLGVFNMLLPCLVAITLSVVTAEPQPEPMWVFLKVKFSICFNFYYFELKMIIAADETRSCSMCRQQPPPWRQPQSATSQARADRQLVGGGRGEPFLPTPWTAQTLEWSPAHWLNLSQLTRGTMHWNSSPKYLGTIHHKRPKPFQLN